MRTFRFGLFLALVSLASLLVGSDADAQRRRRRPRPQPTEQPEPAPEPSEPAAEPATTTTTTTPAAAPTTTPAATTPAPTTPAAAPAEPPPPTEPEPDPTSLPDLEPMRAELATLMDELVQARSRVTVLGRALFDTKVVIRVDNRADDQILRSLVIRLDGDPVHRGDSDPGSGGAALFEGFAAPGPHDLTIEVEQRARANEAYRYLQRNQFRFEVVQGKLTEIVIRLDDDSDMEDFADDGEGEYDVNMRVRVATRDLASGN
jgi:hypothetical protein